MEMMCDWSGLIDLRMRYQLDDLEDKLVVYGLVDPRNNKIRYVGQSKHLHNRYKSHVSDGRIKDMTKSSNPHKARWIAEILKAKKYPNIAILAICSNQEELDIVECEFIDKFTENSVNIAEGGSAGNPTPKTDLVRKKISISTKIAMSKIPNISDICRKNAMTTHNDPILREKHRQATKKGMNKPDSLRKFNESRMKMMKSVRRSDGLIFESLTKAADALKTSPTQINNLIRNGRSFKGFSFEVHTTDKVDP